MKKNKTLEDVFEGCALYGLSRDNHIKTYKVVCVNHPGFGAIYECAIVVSIDKNKDVNYFGLKENCHCDTNFDFPSTLFTTRKALFEDFKQTSKRRIGSIRKSVYELKHELAMIEDSPYSDIL